MNYFSRRKPWYFEDDEQRLPYRPSPRISVVETLREVDEEIRALEHFKKNIWKEEKKEEKKHSGILISMPMIYGMLFLASQMCNILFVIGVVKFVK